ncbi:probable leucine-rich repeat receptor-like protein kinase At1g68400 isoform X2 [Nymphaea colorata]|uniref:probable leucine-rich repeat receptor-like protein kinase At1g68400 isoform X2 n=1 Tax=Nymphaea colorata TaxID=210225 RepID=UPI00129EA5CD|nr:probable leucine-rich repeat receptor-like protein kinase At1g68400 isoform X2 [Nymphaea colorata]
MRNRRHAIVCLLLSLFSLSVTVTKCSSPDLAVLRAFRAFSDPSNSLTSWDSGDPCSGKWLGITCKNRRVTHFVLQGLNLSGPLQPLTELDQLRVLSLKHNSFASPLPDLTSWRNMKLLYLSHNRFSGDFPAGISSLRRLHRLDLSYNELSGRLPQELNRLNSLLTLRLEHNRFTGTLQVFAYKMDTTLEDFNVSGNNLTGAIPVSLSGFLASAFAGNSRLCGRPLPERCQVPKPISEIPLPLNRKPAKRSVGKVAAIVIAIADLCALGLISWALFYCCCRYYRDGEKKWKQRKKAGGEEGLTTGCMSTDLYGKSPTGEEKEERKKEERMVFFQGRKRFRLEDLLKASAEMLGKGSMGSTYKASFDDGAVVVVKRLRDRASGIGKKKSMEHQMQILGGLNHPNVVSLMAYYKSRDEMLLVYDYFPNGSLHALLHGNRGPGRMPLDWTTRLKLALDSAKGLSFVHRGCNSKLFHGNLTASNILIDRAGNACLSDLSISQFVTFSSTTMNYSSANYRAPEQVQGGKRPSQRTDVYSFGIILLEILTGKSPSEGNFSLPKWVQSVVKEEWTSEVFDLELLRYKDMEGEMVALLQIALQCLSELPHQRPKMSQVVKMILDIRGTNDEEATCSSLQNDNSSDSSRSISGETGTTTTATY